MSKFVQLALSTAIAGLLTAPVLADDNTWTIDPKHSSARFSVKHMMVSNVNGQFTKISGSVDYDGKSLKKAKVDASVDIDSVDTNEPHRDEHLKSKDFFDASQFPKMTFTSKEIVPTSDGSFKIVGDLTLHGVKKEITLNAEPLAKPIVDQKGKSHTGTSASGTINRKDFGISFDKTMDNGGAVVGDDVKITLDVELIKANG